MKRILLMLLAGAAVVGIFSPVQCPAPLIWRKGEGWSFERAGVAAATNPKDQLEIARQLVAQKNYGDAIAAYRRLIRRWPTSYAAPDARLGLAECLTATGYLYKSFKAYQELIAKHPNTEHFDTVLQREFEIGNLFLSGARDKVFGIRLFGSKDKPIEIFEQVVKNGPYSKIAPEAQLRIGLANEKKGDYVAATHAYEKLLERYRTDPLAETAQFKIGDAYRQESSRAEYDQNAANQAVAAFGEFLVRYPQSAKVPVAEDYLVSLKDEQARGLFQIGVFYEKQKKNPAALLYFNEVIEKNPKSGWAMQARDKLTRLQPPVTATANP